jgi:hypothetical protein
MNEKIKWLILDWNIRGIGSKNKHDTVREKMMNPPYFVYGRRKENPSTTPILENRTKSL